MASDFGLQIVVWVGLIFLSGYLAIVLFKKYMHFRLCLKLKKRFSHAREGEQSAQELLKSEGFDLEETQKTSKCEMWVNGKPFQYIVRPDAFAVKEGRRYLVEIKTGPQATHPQHSATRRQLLEYFHSFSVDGVLLVNADEQKIQHIYFKLKEAFEKEEITLPPLSRRRPIFFAFIAGFLAAYVIFYVLGSRTP